MPLTLAITNALHGNPLSLRVLTSPVQACQHGMCVSLVVVACVRGCVLLWCVSYVAVCLSSDNLSQIEHLILTYLCCDTVPW